MSLICTSSWHGLHGNHRKGFFNYKNHQNEKFISSQWGKYCKEGTIWKSPFGEKENVWAAAAIVPALPLEKPSILSKWVLNQGLQYCIVSHSSQRKCGHLSSTMSVPGLLHCAQHATLRCCLSSRRRERRRRLEHQQVINEQPCWECARLILHQV